jgi:hypothetical protein
MTWRDSKVTRLIEHFEFKSGVNIEQIYIVIGILIFASILGLILKESK